MMHRYETAPNLAVDCGAKPLTETSANVAHVKAVSSSHGGLHSINSTHGGLQDEFSAGSTTKMVPDMTPSTSTSLGGSKERLEVFSIETRDTPTKTPARAPHGVTGLDHLMAAFGEDKKSKPSTRSNISPKLPHGGALMSLFYGMILVVLGVAFPTKDALHGVWLQHYTPAVYTVYLYGVGFLFLLILEIYLVCTQRKTKSNPERPTKANQSVLSVDPGFINLGFESSSEDKLRAVRGPMPSSCYSSRSAAAFNESTFCDDTQINVNPTSRQTTLYIRTVVIVLGLAAMVYDGLLVKQLQEGQTPYACGESTMYWPRIVHIPFLLMQCYFLFKHSQVKSLGNQAVVRLGFVHVLATNITELVRAFISQSLNRYLYHKQMTNGSSTVVTVPGCSYEDDIMYQASPYLYPCVVEYNFLAAALMYFLFTSLDDGGMFCSPYPTSKSNQTHVSCQRTHKGLFFGIVTFAGTAVSVILFFSYLRMYPAGQVSLLIYQSSDIALHGILIIAVIIAWIQTGKLSSLVQIDLVFEDGVLMISLTLGILFYVFKLIPTFEWLTGGHHDVTTILSLAGSLLVVVAVVMQTCFMMDLSCRYLSMDEEWETKPGRGAVMFLLLTNLAIWLLKSFQVKVLELESGQQDETYGYLPWQLMVHAMVPFMTYYYLFSSACLAKTWQQIYTNPSGEKSVVETSARHERNSTPAKEFEYVRHRKAARTPNVRVDVDAIVSPVSDV